MKKIITVTLCIVLVLLFAGCGKNGDTSKVEIDYGASSIYSKEEIDSAIEIIKKQFALFEGCELHRLSYMTDEECNNADNIEWMNDLRTDDNKEAFTQCIAFESSFCSLKKGGGTWEANEEYTPKEEAKSFHADTYCFDSKPEKECFLQYISSNKVKEIYFTGMFTSNQGDLSVQYYDPESKRLRKYYPDFLALMEDGSYQLIEVKGDNKIDDEVVLAKKAAAEEMAVASGVHYLMYAGSTLMKSNVLEPTLAVQQTSIDI